MRHFQKGAPHEAAKWASVPIINCGDGWGEHPTQVLTDMYTILNEKGTLDGLNFVCVGDGRMRTMHSIGYAASQFDIQVTYVNPKGMKVDKEYLDDWKKMNLRFAESDDVRKVIADADVIYMEPVVQPDYTKSRDDRKGKLAQTPPEFKVTRDLLKKKAKSDCIIIHSLPRMDELPPDVDSTPHARYWEEAFNGVVMRMGLLSLVLGAME